MVRDPRQSIDVYIIVSKLTTELPRNILYLLEQPEISRISLLWNGIERLTGPLFADSRIEHVHEPRALPVACARNTLLREHQPKSEFILWMDEDAYLETSDFSLLFSFFNTQTNVGVVGPLLLYPDRRTQESARLFQTPFMLFLRALSSITGITFSRVETSLAPVRDTTRATPVDWLLGACHLYTRELFEQIGAYDEHYTRVYDEVDFCRRAQHAGYINYFVPFAQVIHTYSRSSRNIFSRDFFRHVSDAFYFFSTRSSSCSSRRSSSTCTR